VNAVTKPLALLPLRIVGYPFRLINDGLHSGLLSFEENNMRERLNLWHRQLQDLGVTPLFGGLGQGTGFGGGAIYVMHKGGQRLQFLGRSSLTGYEEADIQWTSPLRGSTLTVETSYQWRPQENFYGLGHESSASNRTQFALRQTWAGLRLHHNLMKRLRIGGGYKRAWLLTLPGRRSSFPSPDEVFDELEGFNERIQLNHVGVFLDADFLQEEFQWGGQAYLEASLQDRLGGELSYFSYDIEVEGRMPVAHRRSALIGQMQVQLNRERGGSDPLPFFLNPRVGGSSTLRGFGLDRYYGRNLLFATIEYRFRINPNMAAFIFFDEGQVFDQSSDLSWLNWHRNYGLGLKLNSAQSTVLGLEVGYGEDGISFHLTWGDRLPQPLGGPIRYGTYRR
jgi:hypothetical protein